MALTDQPYLPLYVDDWMNNNKLKLCSPGAHGLMISIMCLMHKSEEYGIILLRQKFQQTEQQRKNFAAQIAKLTTFDLPEIESFFYELLDEKILIIDGNKLICSRMVKDADISKKRALSGQKGAYSTNNKQKKFASAKNAANTVNENVNEDENENGVKNGKVGMGENPIIDYDEIIRIFNSLCNCLPSVQRLTQQRKSAIEIIANDYGLTGIGNVFQLVRDSLFLNGNNDRGWTADFDWIMKPDNFIKISEGHYKNKQNGKGKSNSSKSGYQVSDNLKRKIAERLQSGKLHETQRESNDGPTSS